jgi:hypothetical protein
LIESVKTFYLNINNIGRLRWKVWLWCVWIEYKQREWGLLVSLLAPYQILDWRTLLANYPTTISSTLISFNVYNFIYYSIFYSIAVSVPELVETGRVGSLSFFATT